MKQIRLVMIEYLDGIGLEEYLLTIRGIKKVVIDKKEIIINYDSKLISLKVIKLEINLFMGIKESIILMFDKNNDLKLTTNNYILDDICCEYCFLDKIDELLVVEGIYKIINDYDGDPRKNVKMDISYDKEVISWSDVEKILRD